MARPDKHQRQAARARDQVQAACRRGRIGDAVDALCALPSEQRDFALGELAAAMAREIERAFAQRDQASLIAWLGRTEREPRLLDALGECALAPRFSLFSAALRARMWPRAERLWAVLRSSLLQHELFPAIEAVVGTHGQPSGAVLSALARLEEDAARMGYEPARPRATYAPPTRLEEVEACCLRCFGSEPWPRFAAVIESWLRGAPSEIAGRLRTLCAELSARELLLRSRAGNANVVDVARFIAGLAAGAAASDDLEPLIALCLRATARALAAEDAPAKGFEALAGVAATALPCPSLRALVARSVLGSALVRAPESTRTELLRLAVAAESSPATLVAAAIELHAGDASERFKRGGPDWLRQAVATVLATPAELARALDLAAEAPAAERAREHPCAEPCHALFELLPLELSVMLLDRVWDFASESLRATLAGACVLLLPRMFVERCGGPGRVDLATFRELLSEIEPEIALASNRELRELMRTSMGQELLRVMERGPGPSPVLQASMQPLARTLVTRAAAYNLELLDFAISRAESKSAAAAHARAHLARVPTLRGRMRLLRRAVQADCAEAALMIEELLCDGITPSAADAAFALVAAEDSGAPRRIRNRFARALLEAAEREPSAAQTPQIGYALAIARRRARPRKSRAKKPRAGRTGARTAARSSSASDDAAQPAPSARSQRSARARG